jgi:DNA-binding CsgD family transcriptional regulator/PAS domain-containing protein
MARAEAILASVRRIHDASLTADAWQPALQSIIDLLGGDHAILLASDHTRADGAMAACVGMDQSGFARFASLEAAQWIEPAMGAIRSGAAVTRSRLMPDRQFERSGFYNDLVRPVGGFHAMVVAHQAPRLSSFVSVCRPRQAGDFDADEVAVMQALSPHFATALTVRQRLGRADLAAEGAWSALDRLNTGVIVTDATAAVVFANKAAERLFGNRKLCLDGDGLCIDDAAASRKLRGLIAACVVPSASNSSAGGTIELPRSARHAGLRIEVTRFQTERIGFDLVGCDRPLALLLVSDPQEHRRERMAALQLRFGLTHAEAEFALQIVKGDGRAAAATRSNITVGTARSHLERIFEKTGVRRQAELVRLILMDDE